MFQRSAVTTGTLLPVPFAGLLVRGEMGDGHFPWTPTLMADFCRRGIEAALVGFRRRRRLQFSPPVRPLPPFLAKDSKCKIPVPI